jgi:hypothetical protein
LAPMRLPFSRINFPVLIIGIIVCAYAWTKSAVSSFTHDESFTYLQYIHDTFMEIISYQRSYSNNHLLNSLCMKYTELLFGNSELALRLPNLLMFIVFLGYSYFLFKKEHKLLAISVFVLLCTNITLTDIFGLARGYGMSCGFMLMSLFHFIQSFYAQRTRNLLLFHIAALLAIMSSFTLLTVYISLLLLYNLVVFLDCKIVSKEKYRFFLSNKIHLLPLLLTFFILYEPVRKVIKFNKFDFGGNTGFFQDTFASLIKTSFHEHQLSATGLICIQFIFAGIILASTALIIWNIKKGNAAFMTRFRSLIILNFLLLFLSTGIVLQHVILGIDYPVKRFALFLYPIFIIHFGFLFSYFIETGYKKIALPIITSVAFTCALFFGLKTNLRAYPEWGYDQHTKKAMQQLILAHEETPKEKVLLRVSWIFEPTVNYYRVKMKLNWLLPADRNWATENDDYYYVYRNEFDQLNPSGYEVIATFKNPDTWLLKNKKQVKF